MADIRRARDESGDWLDDWPYAPATAVHRDLIKQMTAALVAQFRSADKVAYAQRPGTGRHARIGPDEWEGEWTYSHEFNEVVRQQPKTRLSDVYVVDTPVSALATPQDEETRKGGRRPNGDWPAVMGEWLATVYKDGRPKSKAEARRWVIAAAKRLKKIGKVEGYITDGTKPDTIDKHMIRTFGKASWDSLLDDDSSLEE